MATLEQPDGAPLEWEEVPAKPETNRPYPHEIVTWRAKIPGGWLVSVWGSRPNGDAETGEPVPGGSNWGGGLTFVPDPTYGWKLPPRQAEPT